MDEVHLAATSVALLVMSLFFAAVDEFSGNRDGGRRAARTALVFAPVSAFFAYHLGWLGIRDILLPVGLVLCFIAVRLLDDTFGMLIMCFLAAASFTLWVYYYDMDGSKYGIGVALAIGDPAALAVLLMIGRPKRSKLAGVPAASSPT